MNLSLHVKKKRQQSLVLSVALNKTENHVTIYPDTHIFVRDFSSVNGTFAVVSINSADRSRCNIRT